MGMDFNHALSAICESLIDRNVETFSCPLLIDNIDRPSYRLGALDAKGIDDA